VRGRAQRIQRVVGISEMPRVISRYVDESPHGDPDGDRCDSRDGVWQVRYPAGRGI
jgi:hypothetical protein